MRKTQVSDLRELPVQQGRRVILPHDHKCCDGGGGRQDAVGAEERLARCRLADIRGKN